MAALSSVSVPEIGLAEGPCSSSPLHVRALLQDAVGLARPAPVRVQLRDQDRLGLVKALTALKSGVHHFDTTLSGLDGTLATEELLRLLAGLEVDCTVDPAALDTTLDLAAVLASTDPVGAAG